MTASSEHDVVRSGPELRVVSTDDWLAPAHINQPLIILVHGFTSHGRYMRDLATYATGWGFLGVLFNYDSHLGIDKASGALAHLLGPLRREIETYGLALIGHSMGGLVVRHFLRHSGFPVRAAVLLGAPNCGTMKRRLVGFMLDWADKVTGPNPYARHIGCRASQQLTSRDADQLIANINGLDVSQPLPVPLLSVSGGLETLELGSPGKNGRFYGMVRNRIIQFLIHSHPNDGLVPESSSDITRALGAHSGAPSSYLPTSTAFASHDNTYPSYKLTNHTHISRSNAVGVRVLPWLRSCFP